MKIVELTPVDSSNVAAVGHKDNTLYVEFKHGGLYRYFNVPAETYQAMLAADSVGKFLNAEVKPKHGYELVDLNDASVELANNQQQLDMDGVMVGVSRQALDEALAELRFLRYFYKQAGYAFGPADGDVHYAIVQDYVAQRGVFPPKPYDLRDDDEALIQSAQ